MRGIKTGKTDIRHRVFAEIAKMAYEGGDFRKTLEELPYRIFPGEIGSFRESIFLERAVVGERLRLAMGMPLRQFSEYSQLSDGITKSIVVEKYYEPPLINVIKFACNQCPDNVVEVTNICQGCYEHPCVTVCPKGATHLVQGKMSIDQEKCIKCGRCVKACTFSAIVRQERPCKKACGMNAITSDSFGRAEIDQNKCTSCGQCLVACPFGAIAEKSQIFQTIMAISGDNPVFAALAPSYVGQFGPDVSPDKIKPVFRKLGFTVAFEVAIGADLCTIEEANDFLKEVPGKHSFMVTSCCPSWCDMVEKMFPEFKNNISVALTPMTLMARVIKERFPNSVVVFVGPCNAKKLEACREDVRNDVDFVLTFEEVVGMMEAKGITKELIDCMESEEMGGGSENGRNFAYSGGVANAVVEAIKQIDPTREIKIAHADGLDECHKMLMMAKAGKFDGYLLEGMACPGGCVAGAGTLRDPIIAKREVEKNSSTAGFRCSVDTPYKRYLPLVENRKNTGKSSA